MQMMISYAHKDEKLRLGLDDHLALLGNRKLVDSWHDRVIRAGGNWANDIDEKIHAADIILLLISPAFFKSTYITGVELVRALERERVGDASVIPVILREGDYHGAPFSHLKELPTDGLAPGRSVTGRYWKNRDEAFRDVTTGIRREIERLKGRRLENQAVQVSRAKQNREPSEQDRAEIRGIGESFGRIVRGRRVLWVDDTPDNNVLERAALEGLGIVVETATSTELGMQRLNEGSFDLVISDWNRGAPEKDKPSEGLRLLSVMRDSGVFVPFIVYCGWLDSEEFASRRAQLAARGGSGLTATPRELLRWTVGELVRGAALDPQAEFVEPPLYPPVPVAGPAQRRDRV